MAVMPEQQEPLLVAARIGAEILTLRAEMWSHGPTSTQCLPELMQAALHLHPMAHGGPGRDMELWLTGAR